MRALSILLAGVAAFAALPAAAETVAITGGRVVVGDGSDPIDGGTVVIRDGRIVAAGANVAVPVGATTVDARGKWVTTGVVAGFSRIGLVEVSAVDVEGLAKIGERAVDVAGCEADACARCGVPRAVGIDRCRHRPVRVIVPEQLVIEEADQRYQHGIDGDGVEGEEQARIGDRMAAEGGEQGGSTTRWMQAAAERHHGDGKGHADAGGENGIRHRHSDGDTDRG